MIDPSLQALATAAGIACDWTDAFGTARQVQPDTLRAMLKALQLPSDTPQQCREGLKALKHAAHATGLPPLITCWAGTPAVLPNGVLPEASAYRVQLENGGALQGRLDVSRDGKLQTTPLLEPGYHFFESGGLHTTLAVAPRSCFRVADALQRSGRPARESIWGLSAQVYSLRREQGGGGLGDYTALDRLARAAAAQGASALAISPVHAMFSADAGRFSPYGPSSRLFFNVLHIDPAQLLGADALQQALSRLPGAGEQMARLEAANRVDWVAAAAVRLSVLRQLFDQFRQLPALSGDTPVNPLSGTPSGFKAFCEAGGQALQDHARFEALDAWLRQQQPEATQGDWRHWASPFQDPQGPEVTAFAHANAEEVAFHQFLQWLAAAGCEGVQTAARDAGMPIGVVADLAVGADPGGSQAWSLQSAMLKGLGAGAPPDLLSTQGQGWGLGALSPLALQAHGFQPWLAMLRANMRHCGGIRIDHVLGLKRLWLVPDGMSAVDGAYLQYPLEDLMRLTALESTRHGAIVIGEDLGTVPPGFSEQLESYGVLGIRVLAFQKDQDRFLPPGRWPAGAMACTSTHDLATVAGWWAGRDIDWRERMDLLGTDLPAPGHRAARALEKQALWDALNLAGVADQKQAAPPEAAPLEEVLQFIGSTPAPLVLAPLEDVLGLPEQPNLPGTTHTHPNWQQRLTGDAATLLEGDAVHRRLAALQRGREQAATSRPAPSSTMPTSPAASGARQPA